MRCKRLSLLLLALLLFMMACETTLEPETADGTRVYYYANPDGEYSDVTTLVYEQYAMPESIDDTLRQCDMVLSALRFPSADDHKSVLPDNMLPSCELLGKRARVEVGIAFAELSPLEKSLVTAAISLSLLELEGVRYVTITVEGQEQQLLGNYIAVEHIVLEDSIFGSPSAEQQGEE